MKSWRNVLLFFVFWGLTAGFAFWKGGFAGSFLFYSVGVVFVYILLVQLFSLVRVEVHRETATHRLVAGDEATVNVRIRQSSWMPLAWLVLQEEWSHSGKSVQVRQRVLFFPWLRQSFEYQYTIRALRRGIYILNHSTITGGDIFGLVAKKVDVDCGELRLIAFPKPLTVRQGITGSGRPGGGEVLLGIRYWQNSMQVGGIRDYIHGDPMKRIHWKAVARTQSLKTKEMEPSTTNRTMIFLDAAASLSKRNAGDELFECSVQAAAGLIQCGQLNKMQWGITIGDKARHVLPISRRNEPEKGYELLAAVQPDGEVALQQILQLSMFKLPPETSLLLITPSLEEPLVDAISELRQRKIGVRLIYVQEAPVLALKTRQMQNRLEAMECAFSWICANDHGMKAEGEKTKAEKTERGMAHANS